MTAYMI